MHDLHREMILTLGRYTSGVSTTEQVLRRVVDLAVSDVAGAAFAGITMAGHDGRPTTTVVTDKRAYEIDLAQYECGRGPCLEAWHEDRTVSLTDVRRHAAEYPEFEVATRRNEVRSSLSVPLRLAGEVIGALNLYADRRDAFSEAHADLAGDLGVVVAAIVATASRYGDAVELNEHLRRAMSSRAVIEQAKGIIMASTGCRPDRAFELLRQQSQTENRKLRDIAEEIVGRHTAT